MNRKGFTLIELLSVIVLLGIIVSISFISITTAINKGKVNSCKNIQESIKNAVIEYVGDNRYKTLNVNNFTAKTLTDNNYLSTPIKDPFTKEEISPQNIKIKISLNNDKTVYKVEITNPASLKNCQE